MSQSDWISEPLMDEVGRPQASTHSGSPRITVVVFVRNAVTTIARALDSVMEQMQSNVELIVLDGGSVDGTIQIITRYQDKIDYWRSAPDGGPTPAINEGVTRATGDVICLLPADDWLERGALKSVADAFAADADLDVLSCGTRVVHFDPDGTMRVDAQFVSPDILEFKMDNLVRYSLPAGRFIRRRVYQQLGGHSNDYKFGDFDFLIRMCLAGVKSRVLPRLTYTYRRHSTSTTLSGDAEMVLAMMQDCIRISSDHLSSGRLRSADRRALCGLHGRSSARYAWMLLRRGEIRAAIDTVVHALYWNWAWPILVPVWLVQSWIDRMRYSLVISV
jgi:glycosyltransferase involved in cell wall biosynthesis